MQKVWCQKVSRDLTLSRRIITIFSGVESLFDEAEVLSSLSSLFASSGSLGEGQVLVSDSTMFAQDHGTHSLLAIFLQSLDFIDELSFTQIQLIAIQS
jgi:hypothetical protein